MTGAGVRHLTGLFGTGGRTHRYKGFRILARPYQLADSKRWTVDLEIRHNGWRHAFSADQRFATEWEAKAECDGLGRRIIDGKVPGWSVGASRGGPDNRPALFHIHHGKAVRPMILAGIVAFCLGAFVLLRGAIP